MKRRNYILALLGLIALVGSPINAGKDYDKKWQDSMHKFKERCFSPLRKSDLPAEFPAGGELDDLEKFGSTGQCQKCNLSGFDLRGIISKLNTENSTINLENSTLHGANLSGTNLQGANLNGIRATYANFNRANLENASMNSADLRHSYFYKTKFNNASLFNASFILSYFRKANFTGSNLAESAFPFSDLRKAKLKNATNLDEAFFDCSNVKRSIAQASDAHLYADSLNSYIKNNFKKTKSAIKKDFNTFFSFLFASDIYDAPKK